MSVLERVEPKGLRQGVPKGRRVLIVHDKAGIDFGYWKRRRQECAVCFLSRVKEGRVLATDTDRPPPLQISVFNGGTGNDAWRLNIADLEAGGAMRLESWSLTLTEDNGLAAVPEPEEIASAFGLGLLAFAAWRRRK